MNVPCRIHPAVVDETNYYHSDQLACDFREMLKHLSLIEEKYHIKDKRIMKALEYIRANYQKNILQSEVAIWVRLTPSKFAKKLKEQTFLTFTEILITERIAHGVKLIWETNEPLELIAFDCGFGTGRTFTRDFRQFTGFTPADFRDMCSKQMIHREGGNMQYLYIDEKCGCRQAGNETNHYRSVPIVY